VKGESTGKKERTRRAGKQRAEMRLKGQASEQLRVRMRMMRMMRMTMLITAEY